MQSRICIAAGKGEAGTTVSALSAGLVSVLPSAVSPAPSSRPGLQPMLNAGLQNKSLDERRRLPERGASALVLVRWSPWNGEKMKRERAFSKDLVQPTALMDMRVCVCVSWSQFHLRLDREIIHSFIKHYLNV